MTTPSATTAILNPTRDLRKGTYKVYITQGVTDMAGNALAPQTASFKIAR